jgi:hypothetical protein
MSRASWSPSPISGFGVPGRSCHGCWMTRTSRHGAVTERLP